MPKGQQFKGKYEVKLRFPEGVGVGEGERGLRKSPLVGEIWLGYFRWIF